MYYILYVVNYNLEPHGFAPIRPLIKKYLDDCSINPIVLKPAEGNWASEISTVTATCLWKSGPGSGLVHTSAMFWCTVSICPKHINSAAMASRTRW